MARNPSATAVIARRYAEAALHLSESEDQLQKLEIELLAFKKVFEANADSKEFFASPMISLDEKKAVLADLKESFPLSLRFFTTVLEQDRFSFVSDIVDEFVRRKEKLANELSVEVVVAHPITDARLEEIRQILQSKWKMKLKMQTRIDPQILGGFVAQAAGKLLDASAASQLDSLEQSIAGF